MDGRRRRGGEGSSEADARRGGLNVERVVVFVVLVVRDRERVARRLVALGAACPGDGGFADPRSAALPIVVLSGSAEDNRESELIDIGADDYIRKPVDPPRLLARVRAALRRVA